MPPHGYTGGRLYLGQWAITKDMVVDYIIHYDNTAMSPSIEDVWVNWSKF